MLHGNAPHKASSPARDRVSGDNAIPDQSPMQSKIGCYIIAVAVITVWSTTFVSTKVLLRSLSPEEIMFYRHVLAYLVLLAAYLMPLITMLASWLLLDEQLTPIAIAGGLVILAGVYLSTRAVHKN